MNKRVSRLAANIPMIKENLIPLTFLDVPTDLYSQAILGVYELKKTDLLKDVYIWAYERSADRYAAVRQSLGEPDPFRMKYRDELRQVICEIVLATMGRPQAYEHITAWSENNIPNKEQKQFVETAETEILGLHEGNFARYKIRPSEYEKWKNVWGER